MDVGNFRKHAIPKIEVGRKIDAIRQAIKSERYADQDKRESLKETFKPVTDKLEEEIGELTDEIKDLKMLPAPDSVPRSSTAQPAIEGPTEKTRSITLDPNKGFSDEELRLLRDRGIPTPLEILGSDNARILDKAAAVIEKRRSNIYSKKRRATTSEDQKRTLSRELSVLTKQVKRMGELERGLALKKGSGLGRRDFVPGAKSTFTQPKRNAYKIGENGKYGRLMIDLPRFLDHLQLTATKDGKNVLDKVVDFDTIDLLTKRFNGKKKYSPLSRLVFNELNTLGELPIHKTSKKYSKIGSGVVYFNNPEDLFDKLELLGGSIKAGNDSARNEFSTVAHKLHRLGEITTGQLKSLLGKYLMK